MQDLTHDPRTGGKAYLAPSSMNAGNTTADDHKWSMSAPGSESVLPVPDRLDNLPMPRFTNGAEIPVGHPGMQKKASPSAHESASDFKDVHGVPAASLWKEAG
jgi:hypothetical protein